MQTKIRLQPRSGNAFAGIVHAPVTAAAGDALRLSTAPYEHGSDTFLNVLVAQRTLYAARQTLVAARLSKANNMVTLYASLGGGL